MTKSRSNATAPAAKGELVIGTGTDASGILSVGANNTVLTADSSTSTGLKWAAASSGALTKITRTTFSGVASQSFEGVFTSTYSAYLVVVEVITGNTGSDLKVQFLYDTNTVKATNYYAGNFWINSSASQTLGGDHVATSITALKGLYTTTGENSFVQFWVTPAGQGSDKTMVSGTGLVIITQRFILLVVLTQMLTLILD